MSDVQKCTNEVSHHRWLSDLWEIITDTHFILYTVGLLILGKYYFQLVSNFDGIYLRDEI